MYAILKDRGTHANVILENTDTKAQIVIGRVTIPILDILKEGRPDDELISRDAWHIPVTEEQAKRLSALTMRMKKPVRAEVTSTTREQKKEQNKRIDAMDVLLGLASYK